MAARIPLERGDWTSAASFPRPSRRRRRRRGAQPLHPRRGRGAERPASRPRGPRWRRSDTIARDLAHSGRTPIGRESPASSAMRRAPGSSLPSGDTAGGLALAAAAAGHRGRHRQAPGDPGRAAAGARAPGRHAPRGRALPRGARAYRATLLREPGRARSLFGAARAAELAGDRSSGHSRVSPVSEAHEQSRWSSPGVGDCQGTSLLTRSTPDFGERPCPLLRSTPRPP